MNQKVLAVLTFILAASAFSRAQAPRRLLDRPGEEAVPWKVAFDHGARARAGSPGATLRRSPDGVWVAEVFATAGAVGLAVRLPHEDLYSCSGILLHVRAHGELRVQPFSQSSGWAYRESGGPDAALRGGEVTTLHIPCESMADPSMVESLGFQVRRQDSLSPVRLELLGVTPVPRAAREQPSRPTLSSVEAPASVPRYSIFTASFALGRSYDNPYDPAVIDVQAEFQLPSGASLTIPAFWFQDYVVEPGREKYEEYVPAGDPVWKVRFLGTQVGAHSFRIRARDKDGNTEEAGPFEFAVESSRARGPVGRHPGNALHLQHANGAPYFPRGYNLCFEDGNPDLNGTAYYGPLLAGFGAAGQNWTRLWMTDFARTALEWGGLHFSGWYAGAGKYSQRASWRIDRFMELAAENGQYVQLVLNDHGQFSSYVNARWNQGNPYSSAEGGPVPSDRPDLFFSDPAARPIFQRRLRYVIARWSAYPNLLAWELWNEVQFAGSASRNFSNDAATRTAIVEWHRVMSEYLKTQDPFTHLVTTSSDDPGASGFAGIWNLGTIDMVQSHHYAQPPSSRDARIRDYAVAAQQAYGKPVLIAEMGLKASLLPECDFDPGTFLTNSDIPVAERTAANRDHLSAGTVLRNGIWAAAATQSSGLNWWWGCYIAQDGRRNRTSPAFPLNDRLFPALSSFWGGEDLAREPLRAPAVPVQGNVLAYGLQGRSRAYLWVRDVRESYGSGSPPAAQEGRLTGGAAVSLDGLDEGSYVVSVHGTTGNGELVTEFEQNVTGARAVIPLPPFAGDVAVKVHDGTGRAWGLVPRSARSWVIEGDPSAIRAGYGILRPVAGSPAQAGAAILTLMSGDNAVTDLTVPALPRARLLWTVAEIGAPSEVGLALANPGSTAALLELQLFDREGVAGAKLGLTLAPGQHTARFLAELFPGVPGPFRGTIRVSSDVAVGMLTLRGTKNGRGDFVLTTLPGLLDSPAAAVGTLVLPQVADGGGYQTEWLLVNPFNEPVSGRLTLRQADGTPWTLPVEGKSNSEIDYSIAPHGLLRLISGGAGQVRSGYCLLTPAAGTAAPAAAAVVRFSRDGLQSESGVPFVEALPGGSTYWETGPDLFTGVAFANATDRSQRVHLDLFLRNGGERRLEANVDLPARGQAAKLITELFADLPPSGRGVMKFTADGGTAFLALRIRNTPRGDTLTSSLLFGELPDGEERVFPQIVDGGGYLSRLVVMNPGGLSAEGTIEFRGGSGEARRVLLKSPPGTHQ